MTLHSLLLNSINYLYFTIVICLLTLTCNIKAESLGRIADIRADVDSLKFLHAVWRHGDRSPSVLIPSDTANNISTWEQGLGELTKEGMAQQFRLGKYIRERYDGFISKTYSPFEIYIRSSDYNRTLVSAQANMAGMFVPNESEQFIKNLTWQPIPVHTMPKREDKYRHSDEHKFPDWVNEETRKKIWDLYDLSSWYLLHTNKLIRLRGARMKSVAQNFQDAREKYYAYSGHDTSVASILAAFGIQPKIFPEYATVVFIELHSLTNSSLTPYEQHYVRIFYRETTDGNYLREYDIPGCSIPCTLDKLEKARIDVIPLNWDEECGIYSWYNFSNQTNIRIIGMLLLLCIILLTKVILQRKKLQSNYYNSSIMVDDITTKRLLLDDDDEYP